MFKPSTTARRIGLGLVFSSTLLGTALQVQA